ncbi:MAG TPA: ABC transporter ATP-binding protein, partial [Acetobacteraceae bacterium]|nr:ABC transporter ATP-binding protein [Acetobacteraceae bacterium]
MAEPALLDVRDLRAGYGAFEVLHGVTLDVRPGEVVAVLGSNGVGKTTLNRTLSGLLRPRGGSIRFSGQEIAGQDHAAIVAAGLVHVPEGRRVFPNLTVRENLLLGAYLRGRPQRARNLARVVQIVPRLAERLRQKAGLMCGGEQQMLAIGRALMACPRLLILDEPSLGLAPAVVQQVAEAIRAIAAAGV